MEAVKAIKKLYELKNVDRMNSVTKRKESGAEHSWSCLILADYFMSVMDIRLDRLKVYEILIYHDAVEIEAGDIHIINDKDRGDKKEKELQALSKIKKEMPEEIKEKFAALFIEFEESKTIEAKFCKAIDALDAVIHELDYKEDWQGWTEEILRKKKHKYFEDFPKMKEMFEKIVDYCKKENYFK